jgi:ribosomal protein S18 acetylase RimI-like enzyme
VEIRTFQSEDKEAVWHLLCQFAVSYPPNRAAFDHTFETLQSANHALCLVATVDQQVVGYLIGFVLPTLFANGPIFEIVELSVDEACRTQGHGSALVNHATDAARQKGCVEAVVPTRRAGAFYERLGFRENANYYKLRLAGDPS